NDQNSGEIEPVPSSTQIVPTDNEYVQIKEKEKFESNKSDEKNFPDETIDSQESDGQTTMVKIETKNDDDSTPQNDHSQPSSTSAATAVETKPDENTAIAVVAARPPKKKIFSNREHRNKIEFDAKKFFSSELKDEFDDEIQKSSTTTSESEKKSTDNDVNDDQYIKLKRIKKAHQCHELGETEQFDEDIKYYLSGIVSSNLNSMRCLRFV
ncbi:hypothetical protein BLA29_010317, partial [Euroglyphus maynei]